MNAIEQQIEDYMEKLPAIVKSAEPYPVDFDEAWQWVGYSTKQKGLESLEKNFEKGVDFNLNQEVKVQIEGTRNVKRPFTAIFLTTDCFKAFCMMAGTDKGKEVRRYYLDIERKYYALKQIPQQPYHDYRLIEALNESIRLDAITPEQFWTVLGIPSAQADSVEGPVYVPPPCHDLPDYTYQRKKKIALVSGPEAWNPPIPIIQAFIDDCCIRGVGSMTHLDIDTVLLNWQREKKLSSFINIRQFFKYLGLMGYYTEKRNNTFSVEGLSLKAEIQSGKTA